MGTDPLILEAFHFELRWLLFLKHVLLVFTPPRSLSTLAKEFTAATRIMQSSSNELSTLVSGKAKM